MRTELKRIWMSCLAGSMCLALAAPLQAQTASRTAADSATPSDARAQPEAASGVLTKAAWRGQAPAIATANSLATEAGWQMLQAGGCAIDAAIAAQWVLGLVEPQSSGLGGGGFLVHANQQSVETFDGRETAPAAANETLFLKSDGQPMGFREAVVGGRAVGTPGLVKMLAQAHQVHGCLPWGELAKPAIALAEAGFPVSPRLHALLSTNKDLQRDPQARAYFFDAAGAVWPVGHRLRNPMYADTLRRLAEQGPRGFYSGEVAKAIVAKVQGHATNPGLLSEQDLAQYQSVARPPICFEHPSARATWQVCGMGPPSSGALAVGQILGMLQAASSRREWTPSFNTLSSDWLHAYLEASRLAFADRALYVADPDYVQPPAGQWSSLLTPGYLQARAQLLDLAPSAQSIAPAPAGQPTPAQSVSSAGAATRWPWGAMPDQPEYGTTHLSVVDAKGQLVSMTSSIETAFGAQVMVRGFLLNNQLTDFSFKPKDDAGRPIANRVEPGKRPRSSMAPTVILDAQSGAPLAALGSPGGSFIIHYVAKALWAMAHWGMDAQQAVAAPNFGTTGQASVVERDRFDAATMAALAARGPAVRTFDLTSGTQILIRRADHWEGGADPRREGNAMGMPR